MAATAAASRVLSESDVRALADAGRYVFTCEGRVFDVDVEALMHPGGRDVLEAYRGQDISAAFRGEGQIAHLHSRGARALLDRYCIGVLQGSSAAAAAAAAAAAPAAAAPAAGDEKSGVAAAAAAAAAAVGIDESKPLLPQVVRMEPEAYLKWVDAPSTGHPVMFENPVVERMTCTQWYVVPLLWLPVAGALLWAAAAREAVPLPQLPLMIAAGVLGWQLVEYSIHRWLFHLKPTGPRSIEWHFMLHGHHHKYPMDVDRLVFPPVPAALVMGLFYALLQAVMPTGYALALLGGGIGGYVVYDTTHWALHSGAWDPFVTPVLRTSHMDHHYVNDKVGYGISSTLYDTLLGTLSKQLKNKKA